MRVTQEQQYIEDMGLFFEQIGLTRMAGRILAWLLICEPPHQTLDDMAAALQSSKSSISTSTRMLIQFGFIERVSLPGERRDHYRIKGDIWNKAMERAMVQTRGFRELAQRGLALLHDEPVQRRQRLQEMYDMYTFLERELPVLLEHWEREKRKRG